MLFLQPIASHFIYTASLWLIIHLIATISLFLIDDLTNTFLHLSIVNASIVIALPHHNSITILLVPRLQPLFKLFCLIRFSIFIMSY